jgi:hypothetical protein
MYTQTELSALPITGLKRLSKTLKIAGYSRITRTNRYAFELDILNKQKLDELKARILASRVQTAFCDFSERCKVIALIADIKGQRCINHTLEQAYQHNLQATSEKVDLLVEGKKSETPFQCLPLLMLLGSALLRTVLQCVVWTFVLLKNLPRVLQTANLVTAKFPLSYR